MKLAICDACGNPATRWNGGQQAWICTKDGLVKAKNPQYRCEGCDPNHKWFDIDREDDCDQPSEEDYKGPKKRATYGGKGDAKGKGR